MNKTFYLNGDSWTNAEYVHFERYFNSKDMILINSSVKGDDNLNIIQRTKQDLDRLRQQNIVPNVCVSLGEVGRGFVDEFSLVKPQTQNLSEYLKDILVKEIELLTQALAGYDHYITVGWISNPTAQPSIVDFIGIDRKDREVYTVGNGIYQWISDRQQVFKFSKESFVDCVNHKQQWESDLLANEFIDDTLHINPKDQTPIDLWLDHVMDYFQKIN